MRRFEEAFGSWTEKRLTQEEAAALLGVCPRTFRRYVDRYHEDGLIDKRMGQVSSRRAPADEVLRLEALYRERYDGWSVAHFHDWYRERHGGERSYTWVKNRLHDNCVSYNNRSLQIPPGPHGRHYVRRLGRYEADGSPVAAA